MPNEETKKTEAVVIALVPESLGLTDLQLAELKKALQEVAGTKLKNKPIKTLVARTAPINLEG